MAILVKNKVEVSDTFTYQPLASGEYPLPIPWKADLILSPSTARGNKVNTTNGEIMRVENLADISTINNVNGVPTGPPANSGWGWTEWDNYNLWDGGDGTSWYNYKYYRIIIDLQGIYDLDYIYIYNNNRWLDCMAWSSTEAEPANYRELFATPTVAGNNGTWTKLTFDMPQNQSGCRHFSIGFNYPDASIVGMVLYGRKRRPLPLQGFKRKLLTRSRPVNHRFGTNAFYFEDAKLLASVSEASRFYIEPGWYMGAHMTEIGDGIKNNIGVDDITLEFETNHMGNTDQLLQGYANEGMRVLWAVVANPEYLRQWYEPVARYQCPVDPGLNPMDISVTENPLSYTHMARIFYIVAARYGANPNADVSMINWGPGEVERVGMNVIQGIEVGNEYDAGWNSEEGYMNPYEMAAFMSACYDGHKGEMGAGFGVKNADPSILLSLPGLANQGDYVFEMVKWWDTYRGRGDYPMDIINYHDYNSAAGGQIGTNEPSYALPPEIAGYYERQQYWMDFRGRYLPGAEVWDSETGYDEHFGGAYAPRSTDQFTRSRFKAYWLIRTMLTNIASGVDAINQYWFANVGGGRFEDLDQSQPRADKFISMQLVDGNTDGSAFWGRTPMMSYWYMYHFKNAVKDYYFRHEVVRAGVRRTNEVIVNSSDSRIWATSFTNYLENKSMIVIWLQHEGYGDLLGGGRLAETGYTTLNVTLNVPENTVVVGLLDEAEIRQGDNAREELRTTVLNGGVRRLSLAIGECPIIIYTSNIGTPAPEQPTNIRSERLSSGEMHVVWDDINIENYTVNVKRSTNPTTGFTSIFQGVLTRPEYVDTTAAQGTTYYYQIELL